MAEVRTTSHTSPPDVDADVDVDRVGVDADHASVAVTRVCLGGLRQISWWDDADERALREAFGISAPFQCGKTIACSDGPGGMACKLYLTGPRRLLVQWEGGAETADGRLFSGLAAERFGQVVLSSSRVGVRVTGGAAEAAMQRLVTPNCARAAFPVGCFMSTAVHDVGVMVVRRDVDTFEFWVPRTWAQNLIDYIEDVVAPLQSE